jgi:RHS repeat-associated protein
MRRHADNKTYGSMWADGSYAAIIVAAALAWVLAPTIADAQNLVTTTTRYSYNADGALTAVTAQTDDQPPATTYLTWDDFAPDPADPTTGSVSVGNGRLLGFGPSPGAANEEARFEFDRRDRLVGYSDGTHSIAYDHHATGLMASSALDGSTAWRFYYDDSDNPQVRNIYEPGSVRWSGYLGETRYVTDGSEQVLLQPRKDVACAYEPGAESVMSRRYDAYGAQEGAAPAGTYDLTDNPFQYAHEFRDPVWGGVYLRAPWYDPDFPVFLSRDPMPGQLNHYGYGGGNPVMNTDPSGKLFRRALKSLNKGVGGHFARILLSPFLGPMELAAYPNAFWKQIKTDKDGIDVFLAAGIAAELTGPIADAVAPEFINSLSLNVRFATRLATDAALGLGQSATQAGLLHGVHHFHWNTFGQGAEYTVGGIAWARGLAGVGYRPFGIKAGNLENFLQEKLPALGDGEALIFRNRAALQGAKLPNWTSPIQESRNLGIYHESIVAVAKNGKVYTNEMLADGRVFSKFDSVREYVDKIRPTKSTLQFIGRKSNFTYRAFWGTNPLNFAPRTTVLIYQQRDTPLPNTFKHYDAFRANCQDHAAEVLKQLGVR